MKIYAIRHKATGRYVRLGRNERYTWNQFPTVVIKANIPVERRIEYEVDEFDLNRMEPVRRYTTTKKTII